MALYPAGYVLAKCIEWALTETKKGDPQIFLRFKALDDTDPPGYFGGFSDKSLPHTLKALRACGWQGTDISELDHHTAGLDANEVSLKIEHEVWEGVERARVSFVNVPGQALKPLDPAKKANFAAQLKGQILALEMGKPPTAKPSPRNGPPPGHPADADILF